MLQKMGLSEALEFSNAAAALNCTAIGARGHVPTIEEVNKLLKDARAGKVQRRGDQAIEQEAASASAAAALRKA